MKKIFLLIFSTYFLVSCDENKITLDLAEDIVHCSVKDLDSLLERNRPITNLYLDSVLSTKPSIYFKNSNDFFNQKKCFLYLKGGNYSKGFLEYYVDYKLDEDKVVKFTFIKKNDKWELTEILPFKQIDFN